MKKILFSVAAFVAFTSAAFSQTKAGDVAKFSTETIDFGKIKQGVPTKGTFVVTNVGATPLIIEQANPTCGCTISDYTKEPIAAGKTGLINATYNAANPGHFEKHLTVKFAGVDELKSITLTGDVVAAADYDKWKADNEAKVKAMADSIAAAKPVKTIKKLSTKTKTSTKTKSTK